jgi:2,4-diaminopentanoate dehydrogenase
VSESQRAPYRVVQWATGGVGKAAIEGVLAHPELELIGCWVHSADKAGRDVGELIGGEPIGVTATDDKDAIAALDADCVLYAPLLPDPAEVEALLRSGKNVVTPVGWFYPMKGDDRLARAATESGVTLHGTGIDPGGITELVPLVLSSLTAQVTHVRVEEFSDIRTYDAPDVVRHIMLFGGTPEAAMSGPMIGLLTGGFTQSIRMLLDGLGFPADAVVRTDQAVAVATQPLDTPIGVIARGQVAAQRFAWEAVVGDEVVARLAVNWLMGEEHLEPAWGFGPEGERYEVEITGDPSTFTTIRGFQPATPEEGWIRNPGIVATANHVVSSVPYVCAAAPGHLSYLDLPLISGRAHPRFSR